MSKIQRKVMENFYREAEGDPEKLPWHTDVLPDLLTRGPAHVVDSAGAPEPTAGRNLLGHWGKRHAPDWRPIGPRRRTADTIKSLFAPDLELLETESTDERVPFPFGPWVRMSSYWFRRAT